MAKPVLYLHRIKGNMNPDVISILHWKVWTVETDWHLFQYVACFCFDLTAKQKSFSLDTFVC